mgnify:CR=1 FL=1
MRELKGHTCCCTSCEPISCSPNPYDEGTESLLSGLVLATIADAAAQIPMMRELKVRPERGPKGLTIAAAQIPMMRELKDTILGLLNDVDMLLQPKSL